MVGALHEHQELSQPLLEKGPTFSPTFIIRGALAE
jgi:hypothetical protein